MRAGELEHTTFDRWAAGYGVIPHARATRARIQEMATRLQGDGVIGSVGEVYRILAAADRVASAAMWVVVHMTYANRVDLSGGPLPPEAFKPSPQGHTGGSLNVVPAYVGYLAANLITAQTRGWLLGQGHCSAAIEAVNALVGNLSRTQQGVYGPDEAGLSRLCQDFYSYRIDRHGRAEAPVGSHVTPHTAGGVAESGYLGFAEIQYLHMPLPGESLVAILSDGAFEEQRGSDWSERWWRAEDCGLVAPVMILNGRRIEQRTEIAQDGGERWLADHLTANGFDPIQIDGRDPAAFAWAILEQERRLKAAGDDIRDSGGPYPVRLPFSIAATIKGYGFPGAGGIQAHNLPLGTSPHEDEYARDLFNAGAGRLFVPVDELAAARAVFDAHERQGRPKERDNPIATRCPALPKLPAVRRPKVGEVKSAMDAMDDWFVEFVRANPAHRFRVGNPDELQSNHMGRTLQRLKHRVNRPEPGLHEAVDGAVITALNEEAVAGAALGNKAGLNLIVSYEAFATKMLGVLRQEVIFARQQREAGYEPGWIGVPLIATSHLWENGKNQQSHQDPTIGEALMGEMADVSRVLFPVDAASAQECLRRLYQQRGVIGCVVAAKTALPNLLTQQAATNALNQGFITLSRDAEPRLQLVAIGACQLAEMQKAALRLREAGVPLMVTAILEPGRLRHPRDELEAEVTANPDRVRAAFPAGLPRVIATHTRPEPMAGVLRAIDVEDHRARWHGYINRGGTLDLFGMLFANRSTWAHLVLSAGVLLGLDEARILRPEEQAAVGGYGDPQVLRALAPLEAGQRAARLPH